jgi:hypothetical protein
LGAIPQWRESRGEGVQRLHGKNTEFLMRRAGHDLGVPAEPSAF